MTDFHEKAYWKSRFDGETAFEWLVPSGDFFDQVIRHQIGPQTRVLHLGFGTSDLQNHIRSAGCEDVLNIDFEPTAITRGQDLEMRQFGDVRMSYAVADATDLPAEFDGQFDLVVDKSTADAVSCGGDAALLAMAASVRRALTPTGRWLCCSYSATRFDGLPDLAFDVRLVHRFHLPKARPTDPDLFHACYLLVPHADPA